MIKTVRTLPRMLAASGYRCLQTGKFWEGHYRNAGFTHGMTVFKGVPDQAWGGNRRLANDVNVAHGNGDVGLRIGRVSMQPIYDFIDEVAGQPFFIWYAPYLPHEPHDAPQAYYDRYAGKAVPKHYLDYYASCSQFDDTVGDLLSYLDRKGLSENTVFVLVSDNGWTPDAERKHGKWRGYHHTKSSKRSPNEDGLRTPILFRWDGHYAPKRYDELVSSVDIVPTLLAAAGLAAQTVGLPGKNLHAALVGTDQLDKERAVFGEIYPGDASVLRQPGRDIAYRWVRKGAYKLIVMHGKKPWGGYLKSDALFDVVTDPKETRNLIAQPSMAPIASELRQRLDDWWKPRS